MGAVPVAGIISGALKGLSGIIGQSVIARKMRKESDKQREKANAILASTENKPLYELAPETLERERVYRDKASNTGRLYDILGRSTDDDFARSLSSIRNISDPAMFGEASTISAQNAANDQKQAALLASGLRDKYGNVVDQYVGERESANEMNWGIKLGDVLRKEQLGYDYLSGAEQNRLNRYYALADTISSSINWAGDQVGMIGSMKGGGGQGIGSIISMFKK